MGRIVVVAWDEACLLYAYGFDHIWCGQRARVTFPYLLLISPYSPFAQEISILASIGESLGAWSKVYPIRLYQMKLSLRIVL